MEAPHFLARQPQPPLPETSPGAQLAASRCEGCLVGFFQCVLCTQLNKTPSFFFFIVLWRNCAGMHASTFGDGSIVLAAIKVKEKLITLSFGAVEVSLLANMPQ